MFLYKYDLKYELMSKYYTQIKVLYIILVHLFLEKNNSEVGICVWQMYVSFTFSN